MTRASCCTALLLLLSSLHWLATADKVPAIINSDSPMKLYQRPVLQPKETTPPESLYILRNPQGKVCVRANLGVEYVVRENKDLTTVPTRSTFTGIPIFVETIGPHKKNYFFNLNPKNTEVTGYCGNQKSIFSLEFDGGHLEFTYIKEGDLSYVSNVKGLLRPLAPCQNCQNKTYVGVVSNEKLFKAKKGLSFKCKSQTTLPLASYFRVKLVPLQIQAFEGANQAFGKEVECWSDYNKRMLPIILGAVAAAVCLIAILTYVLVRERRNHGYEQL